jgi:hypothetical protein
MKTRGVIATVPGASGDGDIRLARLKALDGLGRVSGLQPHVDARVELAEAEEQFGEHGIGSGHR